MTDEGLAHEGPYQVEEAQFVSGNISYNFKPNNNLLTHYTPALKNHENFSYQSGVQHGLKPVQNFHHQYAPQGFQGQQQQQQSSQRDENYSQIRSQSFEDQMLSFMGKNKRMLNIHEQKFAKLVAFQENKNVF